MNLGPQMRPLAETRWMLEQRDASDFIAELDPRLNALETRLRQMRDSWDSIRGRALELDEARHVLLETGIFFRQAENNASAIMDDASSGSVDYEPTAPLLENALEGGDIGVHTRDLSGMSLECAASQSWRNRWLKSLA